MRRHLFTILSAILLVICVATCVLWLRSYFIVDDLRIYRPRLSWQLGSLRGTIYVIRSSTDADFWPHSTVFGHSHLASLPYTFIPFEKYRLAGFVWGTERQSGVMGGTSRRWPIVNRVGGVPYWLMFVASAAAPTMWLRGYRLRHRPGRGQCQRCGYDLRATPDRCPECGRAVTTKGTMPAL